MDDCVGAGKVLRADLAAKVIAAAEGDVRPEFFVQQYLADRFDAEGGEHAETQFRHVAVGRLAAQFLRFLRRDGALAEHFDGLVVLDAVVHDLVAELHRQHAGAAARFALALVGHDVGFAGRQVARRAGLWQQAARGVRCAEAQVEVQGALAARMGEDEVGPRGAVELVLEIVHTAIDLGVVEPQGGDHRFAEAAHGGRPERVFFCRHL